MFLIKNETQTIQNVVFGQLKIQNKRKILCFVDDNFLTTIIVDTKSSHYRAICKLLFACVYLCFKCIVFTTWSEKMTDGISKNSRRIFELMLIRWKSQPIKSQRKERRPIRERAQSINLKTGLIYFGTYCLNMVFNMVF